jgi:hypothetical protein
VPHTLLKETNTTRFENTPISEILLNRNIIDQDLPSILAFAGQSEGDSEFPRALEKDLCEIVIWDEIVMSRGNGNLQ